MLPRDPVIWPQIATLKKNYPHQKKKAQQNKDFLFMLAGNTYIADNSFDWHQTLLQQVAEVLCFMPPSASP